MLSKSSKWELGFVHYITKFTISRFVISRFECTSYSPINFAYSKYPAIDKLIKQNKTANQNLVTNLIHFGGGELDPDDGSKGYSTTSWLVSLFLIGKNIFFVKVHATDL